LGSAVDQESLELLTVLLEAESNHPSLNIYSCLVYCMYKQKLALFKELLERAKKAGAAVLDSKYQRVSALYGS